MQSKADKHSNTILSVTGKLKMAARRWASVSPLDVTGLTPCLSMQRDSH